MFAYNRKNSKGESEQTKFITTDDIIIGSDSTKSMEDLTTAIAQNSTDIQELRSNIKWLAAHGGSGSGGSGGSDSGSTSLQPCAFSIQATYVDTDGKTHINEIVTEASETSKDGQPATKYILVRSGTAVTFTLSQKYNASLSMFLDGTKTSLDNGTPTTIVNTQSFTNLQYTHTQRFTENCTLTFKASYKNGKEKYDRQISFMVFTTIIESKLGIYTTNTTDWDVKVTSKLDTTTLEENKYALWGRIIPAYSQFTLSNFKTTITYQGKEQEITELTNQEGAWYTTKLSQYINPKSYGIYTLKQSYTLQLGTGEPKDYSTTTIFILQNKNEPFIYCQGNIDNSVYVAKQELSNPSLEVYSDTKIALNMIIYGTSTDGPDKQYSVSIYVDGEPFKENVQYKVSTNYTIYIPNKTTTETPQEIAIMFNTGSYSYVYYIYTKKAEEASFILKGPSGNYLYGTGTKLGDSANNTLGNFFKESLPAGNNEWVFSQDTNFTLNSKVYDLQENNSGIAWGVPEGKETLSGFIENTEYESITENLEQDGLICIGVKNKVASQTGKLFTISQEDISIIIYNQKIQVKSTTSEVTSYTRFALPQDDDSHLISIYFKSNYIDLTNSTNTNSNVFMVFIDGVLETAPITAHTIRLGKGFTLTLSASASIYNFLGGAVFLPRNANWKKEPKAQEVGINVKDEKLRECIYKYLTSFDPLIPANYFAVYQKQVLQSKNPYEPLSASTYARFTNGGKSWISHFNPDTETSYDVSNKFTTVDTDSELMALAGNIPIYRISPVAKTKEAKTNFGINSWIQDTVNKHGETDSLESIECDFEKLVLNGSSVEWEPLIKIEDIQKEQPQIQGEHLFTLKFQGSSTLLYSIKNFELSTNTFKDDDSGFTCDVYFNPDENKFAYSEKSFNLKADLVDSSSSTNNVIGNIVNEYMKSPFGNGYQSCLSGMPIILCIQNNIINENEQTEDLGTFILGIYNMNLNRSSANNLGYQKLASNVPRVTSAVDANCYVDLVTDARTQIEVCSFMSAEIGGNSTLFDFSQYDAGLLADKMFGDFKLGKSSDGIIVDDQFDKALVQPIKYLSLKVRELITGEKGDLYFNVVDYAKYLSGEELNVDNLPSTMYYRDQENSWKELQREAVQSVGKFYLYNTITDKLGKVVYMTTQLINNKPIAVIGNSKQQFRLIYTKSGSGYSPLIEQESNVYQLIDNTDTLSTETTEIVDIEAALRYYCICMAFGMVDSVQKNLNIKCPDITSESPKWYLQFYDMDTAMGINNSGGESNVRCFSGYVENNIIISDYVSLEASSWFDIPSSMAFLYAKYATLINAYTESTSGSITWTDADNYNTPFVQWQILRGAKDTSSLAGQPGYGILQNADYFCDNYLYKHLEGVHPLLMNINYMYKYFSTRDAKNTSEDTELSRFWGTLKWVRKWWFKQRLQFLDAMFGFNNTQYIGSSTYSISDSSFTSSSNTDIGIFSTMYPQYNKNITQSNGTVRVKGPEMYPLVVTEGVGQNMLYFLNGVDNSIQIPIKTSGSLDRGFYGSGVITTIDNHGIFLTSTQDTNTIQNKEITDVTITSFGNPAFNTYKSDTAPNITLTLYDIPNCKSIKISSTTGLSIGTLCIDGRKDKNDTESTYSLDTVTLQNLTVKEISFNNIASIGTLHLSNISGILTFSSCTIKQYNEEDMKITTLNIGNTTFEASNTTFSSTTSSTVNIQNLTFNTQFTLKYLLMESISIDTLIGTGSTNTFINQYLKSSTQETLKVTGTMANVHYIKLNNEWTIPQGAQDASNRLNNTITTLQYDFTLGSVGINGNTPILSEKPILSIPGCTKLKTITTASTNGVGAIPLGQYGIAYSPLKNDQVSFIVNSGYATFFGCPNIYFNNISTCTNNDPSAVKGRIYFNTGVANPNFYCFHSSAKFNGTAKELLGLLTSILYYVKPTDISYAFIGNTSTDLSSASTIASKLMQQSDIEDEDDWEIVNIKKSDYLTCLNQLFTLDASKRRSTLALTGINFIPKNCMNGKNWHYSNTLGACYIEQGAAKNIIGYDASYGALLDKNYSYEETTTTFIKLENGTYKQYSPNFKDEFSNLKSAHMSIATSYTYPLDLEGGLPESLNTYYTILGYGQRTPYIVNGTWKDDNGEIKSFLDTSNVTDFSNCAQQDFTGINFTDPKLSSYTKDTAKYYINIYHAFFKDVGTDGVSCELKNNNFLLPQGQLQYWSSWAMYKVCTYNQFIKILRWLKNLSGTPKTTINNHALGSLFKNCTITECPSDISFTEADDDQGHYTGYLYGYTNLQSTFHNCKFVNNSGEIIPISLKGLFAKYSLATDTYKINGTSVSQSYNNYQTTSVQCLHRAFMQVTLKPFEEFSYTPYSTDKHAYLDSQYTNMFGITPGSTRVVRCAFQDCPYTYDFNQWGTSTRTINVTSLERGYVTINYYDAPSLFPTNFLNFLGNSADGASITTSDIGNVQYNYEAAFSQYGTSMTQKLQGIVPLTNTWGLNTNLIISNFIGNCLIYYQQDEEDSTKEFIFPNWYMQLNNFQHKYDVIIPLPWTSSSDHKSYLWNGSLQSNTSNLPKYNTSNGSGSNSVGDKIKDYILRVNLNDDTQTQLPNAEKQSIPRDLAYTLNLSDPWFTNITELVNNKSSYQPLINHNIDSPNNNNLNNKTLAQYIFRQTLSQASSEQKALILGDASYIS